MWIQMINNMYQDIKEIKRHQIEIVKIMKRQAKYISYLYTKIIELTQLCYLDKSLSTQMKEWGKIK